MAGKIFLIDGAGTLKPMKETAYESESLLQGLLEKYPEVLAGQQSPSESDHRWLLVSREYGVPGEDGGGNRWSLDHLFLDQDAIPTLVEVKRSTDTRSRREVVAQMLDYAANAVAYWPVEDIRAKLEAVCEERQTDPAETIIRLLGDRQAATDPVGEFWQLVKTNLQAGRIRMVFVADQIPSELRRIVEFLNEQMDPAEVFAIEVRQFVGENVTTLVPTVKGLTEAAQQKKKPPRRSSGGWTQEDFFRQLEDGSGEDAARVARDLLEWIEPKVSWIFWGMGSQHSSMTPTISVESKDGTKQKASFFSLYPYGSMEIKFESLRRIRPFDSLEMRKELGTRLRVTGLGIPEDSVERRPAVRITALADPKAMMAFRQAIEWGMAKVRSSAAERDS